MFNILKEDFIRNSSRSFIILLFYRIMHFSYKKNYLFTVKILNICFHIIKIFFSIQSQISYKAEIGRRIRLPHIAFGVIISSKAKIGNNITIYHLVTIGINENKCKSQDEVCVEIGDNSYISTGVKIISAKVGNNCILGPNSVVYKDIPDGSKVYNGVIFL